MSKLLKKFRNRQDEFAEVHIGSARAGKVSSIYKLFNRYYIKSFFGPFFTFVFPVLIYAILGTLMDYKLMFAGVCAMSGMSGLTGMPFSILELKKSVLLKRIGASPVKTSTFTVVIVTYFVATIFLSVLWLMLWALIIHQNPSMFDFLGTVKGFFAFFYGNILNIVISISLGFFVASISKNEQQAQAISMLIMFPSQFLSGMFITIDTIAANDVMNWISRIIPFRYSTMYLVSAQIPGMNPFAYHDILQYMPVKIGDLSQYVNQELKAEYLTKHALFYKDWETVVAYVYPWATIAGCTYISIKKFSWSAAR